jgi:C-terminal processing protease CtpA/Prc
MNPGINPGICHRTTAIAPLKDGSSALAAGLKRNDEILAVDGNDVNGHGAVFQ